MDAVELFPESSCNREKYFRETQKGLPVPKRFNQWKVSSPAQGIHSAVRMTASERTEMDVEPLLRVVAQTTNQTAIQLLKTLKVSENHYYCLKSVAEALRELEMSDITLKSSKALNTVMECLVRSNLEYSDNIPVLEKLLELGCTVPVKTISSRNSLMSIRLIEKLCSYSENPEAFVRKNLLLILSLGEKRSYQLLRNYLAEQEIIQVVRNEKHCKISSFFEGKVRVQRFLIFAPKLWH